MPRDEQVLRAYVQLKAFADIKNRNFDKRDVDDYHEILDNLEVTGYDMSDFRLNWQRDSFESSVHFKRMFPSDVFNRKLTALLLYFEIKQISRVELRAPLLETKGGISRLRL